MEQAKQAPSTVVESFFGLVERYGHEPDAELGAFVRLAAAVQQQQLGIFATDVEGLTPTTALWTIAHLDAHLGRILESGGAGESQLARVLSLPEAPQPA